MPDCAGIVRCSTGRSKQERRFRLLKAADTSRASAEPSAARASCQTPRWQLPAPAVHLPAECEASGGCKNEFDGKTVPRSVTPLMSRTNLLCPSTLHFQSVGQFVFMQITHTVRKNIYIYIRHMVGNGWLALLPYRKKVVGSHVEFACSTGLPTGLFIFICGPCYKLPPKA